MKKSNRSKANGPDNSILFVAGRKGSGKTTLIHAIAALHDRVFVLDSMGSEGEPEYRVVFGFDECISAIEQAAKAKTFRISLRCPSTDELLALVPIIETVEDCLLVVDEASFYCSPNYLPDELSSILRYGRHARISQIYAARRPSEIHREVTAAADVVITFQHHEPRDLAYFRALGGERFAERVRNLPRFRCAVWGDLEKAPSPALEAASVVVDGSAPME